MLMNSNNRRTFLTRYFVFALFAGAILICGGKLFFAGNDLATTALAQQDPLLERRISQIEQRFYLMETRLSRIEQETRYPAIAPRTNTGNDVEVSLLRSQLETLQRRLAEVECGAVRLDERTLTAAAREARNKSGTDAAADPCRLNPGAPLRLSARP